MRNLLNNKTLKHPLIILFLTAILAATGYLVKHYFFEPNNASNLNENYNVINSGINNGVMAGKVEIDSPAQFSATSTLNLQPGGEYLALIKAVANKETNLPRLLCVIVETDAKIRPASRLAIRNDGVGMSQISVNNNYACIQSPTSHVTAYFLLETKPSIFKIYTTTKQP